MVLRHALKDEKVPAESVLREERVPVVNDAREEREF